MCHQNTVNSSAIYWLNWKLQFLLKENEDFYINRNISPKSICACAKLLSSVWLFATLWTVTREAPLSMGILRARILECVAIPSSRGIFPTQESNSGLPHSRWILYLLITREAQFYVINNKCYYFKLLLCHTKYCKCINMCMCGCMCMYVYVCV